MLVEIGKGELHALDDRGIGAGQFDRDTVLADDRRCDLDTRLQSVCIHDPVDRARLQHIAGALRELFARRRDAGQHRRGNHRQCQEQQFGAHREREFPRNAAGRRRLPHREGRQLRSRDQQVERRRQQRQDQQPDLDRDRQAVRGLQHALEAADLQPGLERAGHDQHADRCQRQRRKARHRLRQHAVAARRFFDRDRQNECE